MRLNLCGLKSLHSYRSFYTSPIISMKYSIQILGIPNGDLSPSVLLQFDSKSYLFNACEGTQRFCFEHKIRLSKLRHIFLTRINWDQMGGLPGMMLTLNDITEEPVALVTRGPTGLLPFIRSTRHFIHESARSEAKHLEINDESDPFQDENITVEPIILRSSGTLTPTKRKADEIDASTLASDSTIAYICRGPKIPRKFDAQAAMKLGIKPGYNFQILAKGQSVTLENGTVVEPDQVLKPMILRDVLIIVDCPSVSHIPNLIANLTLERCVKDGEQMSSIVHMLGQEVLEDEQYRLWMSSFGEKTQHILCSPGHCIRSLTTISSAKIQRRLSQLDDRAFSIPFFENTPSIDISSVSGMPSKYAVAKPLLRFQFQPKPLLIEGEVIGDLPKMEEESEQFLEQVQIIKESRANDPLPVPNDLEIVPLGTGSSIPGKYRNVSSTLVQLPSGSSILFDCGEGTYGQLLRHFGPEKLKSILASINLVCISHLHGDHHFGSIKILKAITKQRSESERVIVVAPNGFYIFMTEYSSLENFGFDFINFIESRRLLPNQSSSKAGNHALQMMSTIGIRSFKTVEVDHCHHAYAYVLDTIDQHRIAYSGDCRPSDDFIREGQGADILIHEATFNDEKKDDAIGRKHCTISEAVQVGKAQRYPKIPDLKELGEGHEMQIGIAFDLMRIGLKDFGKLSRFSPALKLMFEEPLLAPPQVSEKPLNANESNVAGPVETLATACVLNQCKSSADTGAISMPHGFSPDAFATVISAHDSQAMKIDP